MIIVDTTVWVDYLRGDDTPETHWLERNLERQRLGPAPVHVADATRVPY